ncbi:MAG: PD-(D/E)XK nuclease family protein, partial [Firmicutes bacterium]|nr:PD-(D/E)XK nuclease family protein [Bacillota bacterium]
MEQLPFTPEGKSEEEIAAFIEKLREGGILTPQEAQAVRPAQIAAFFASPLARRIYASPEVCKETPFTMKHRLGDREVLVQGVIDCFFREEDGYVLIDYKSNYVDPLQKEASYADLRAHYLPQLALYREALEGVTGQTVKKAVLYCFGIDKEISIDEQS